LFVVRAPIRGLLCSNTPYIIFIVKISNMLSYKQIVDLFADACNKHLAIKDFGEGSIDYLDAKSQNISYPYIFIRPVNSPGLILNNIGQSGARTLSFEMYSLDIPKLQDDSPLKLKSDTERYLYDIISYFNLGDTQQDGFCTLQGITPVNEAFNDRAYGWMANISYTDRYVLDYCAFPKL
jgi:hypothetical protein